MYFLYSSSYLIHMFGCHVEKKASNFINNGDSLVLFDVPIGLVWTMEPATPLAITSVRFLKEAHVVNHLCTKFLKYALVIGAFIWSS